MKFNSENATFLQSGFNFYIGDIIDENTIIFNEDAIVIGNLNSEKNIFAMGELIVIGNIECKSIYVTKDFLSLGDIVSEVLEVEGSIKTLDKSIIPNINISKTVNYENKEEKINIFKEEADESKLDEIYKRYLNKKGKLIEGKVCSINDDKAIVDLGDTKASLLIDKNEISMGMELCAYIKSVILYNNELSITLENKDRSYITKIINRELNKNKYDISKVYFKKIEMDKDKNIVEILASEQFNDSSLKIIEGKISKYFHKKITKLNLYGSENKCNKNEDTKVVKDFSTNTNDENIKGFKCGDKILHNKFGEGEIVSIINLDTAEIDFKGIMRNMNIPILIQNRLIKKKVDIDKCGDKLDTRILNSNEYIETNKSRLSGSESKKHTLVTGIVTKVDREMITLKIDKNIIGVLNRKYDVKENILYHIGDEVTAYILNIYKINEKIELQLIKNNSNYFKLLFEKYKDYLHLKNCNLKLCKYVNGMGALIIIDKKYKFTEQDILIYIIQLMNKSVGVNIVRVIDYVYNPYAFLSNIFDVSEKDIYNKNGIYYVNNFKSNFSPEVHVLCEDLEKITEYKVKIN